ncbi:MAG: hypothetical protein CMJ62_00655 [Planctomycetaceae bacterium]|nr:hypothetical protein [Planctomycetaceae bacterium]
MSVSLQHNRWAVTESDFAARVAIPDLKGFFDKLPIIGTAPKGRSLVVEPGTRALVIDEGMVVGEVAPGQYTLESFLERLEFWRNKQATIFLTRAEDVPVESEVKDAPCVDGVFVSATYRWTIQMNDVLSFLNNLMGAHDSISVAQLEELLAPMVGQAVRDVIGQASCEEIRGPEFSRILASGIRTRVGASLKRYGLLLQDLQSFQCLEGDDFTRQKGEIYLQARETQLQRAVADVANDRLKARLEEYENKIPVRKSLRDAVSDDGVDKLQSAEDFKRAISEIDKQRLIRKEDQDALTEAYEERKEDRGQLREHLIATIDMQREQELDSLRVDLDHAVRMQSLEKEIELTRLSRSGDAEEWRADLERNKDEMQHRWQQKREKVKARWGRIREERRQGRDDSWEEVLHQQRMEEVESDLEIARAERRRKIAILEAELRNRLDAEKLEVQKRQQEWELEVEEKKSLNQMERLHKVQEMNAKFAEQQQRMQLEMENLKADSDSKRELDRIKTMGSLSTEALVATASGENATLLADLKKHEASQEAAKAQAASSPSGELDQERLRMYEKLNETERAKADAIAEAFKTAMDSQQGNVQQMIGGLAQASTRASSSPPSMPTGEIWHVSLNGQQSPPLQLTQVHEYIQNGQVNSATMVWKTGMAAWAAAGQVPELAPLLGKGPPGPPPN